MWGGRVKGWFVEVRRGVGRSVGVGGLLVHVGGLLPMRYKSRRIWPGRGDRLGRVLGSIPRGGGRSTGFTVIRGGVVQGGSEGRRKSGGGSTAVEVKTHKRVFPCACFLLGGVVNFVVSYISFSAQ